MIPHPKPSKEFVLKLNEAAFLKSKTYSPPRAAVDPDKIIDIAWVANTRRMAFSKAIEMASGNPSQFAEEKSHYYAEASKDLSALVNRIIEFPGVMQKAEAELVQEVIEFVEKQDR